MNTALLIFLLIISNLSLYWLFWGKKRFEQKYNVDTSIQLQPEEKHGRT